MARILHLAALDVLPEGPLAPGRLLPHLDRSRWEPAVVCLGPPPAAFAARLRALGAPLLALESGEETGPLAVIESLLLARRLPRLLGGQRFDLVHAWGEKTLALGGLALTRTGARALVSSFDGQGDSGTIRPGPLARRAVKRVTRFVIASAALAPSLLERHGAGPGRSAVVPAGIDLAEADAGLAIGRGEARRRLGLFATDIAIACRAPLGEGAAAVLAAFRGLLQQQPTARLLVAGDDPSRGALAAAVGAMRLDPFVRLLGALADPWPLLAAADLFVLPAGAPGVPAELLEAMAAGLPIVAVDRAGVAAALAGGGEALLVPSRDPAALSRALADLAAAPERRRELGAQARRRVEEGHRIEQTAAALEALYAEVLAPLAAG